MYTHTATCDHHSGEYEWYSNCGHQCGHCTKTTDREDVRGAGGDYSNRKLLQSWEYFAGNELNYSL